MHPTDNFETHEDYDKWLSDYYGKMERCNTRLMKIIEHVKGPKFVEDLKVLFEDSLDSELSIVSSTTGDYQEEDGTDEIPGSWVDQYVNGGYTGDTYQGFCYVELKPEKYLKWHYSM